jgi:putative spermidine/putrescine transport system permease protein
LSAAGHIINAPEVSGAIGAHAIAPQASGRPWTFYVLLAVFIFYVLALYGPMICIYILSFQDVRGGLVFPMKGLSLHWFVDLFTQVRTGDVKGSFDRSVKLAVIVTIITVVVSFLSGLAFRRRFRGDGIVFYLMIGSLVAPGLVLSIGVGLLMSFIGIEAAIRCAGDVCGYVALRPRVGGGGLRPWRYPLAGDPLGRDSDPRPRSRRRCSVRLHSFL